MLALKLLDGIEAEVSLEYTCDVPSIRPAATVLVAFTSVTPLAGLGSDATQLVPLLVL